MLDVARKVVAKEGVRGLYKVSVHRIVLTLTFRL
jgi:hypothetical protein